MNRAGLRLNQFMGIIVGLVGALMTANFWPHIRQAVGGWGGAILWGVALGGLFGSLGSLHAVGRLITRRENHTLNALVGLLAPFALITLLLVLLAIAR
ncbi:MAG: hypothetical protein QF376_01725 [Anaerolineales bacterium]|jgi:hypothetical protein|nr:hypothetical protein [Anaerolineales bacterium]HJO34509.1 hypothetical protein [Anaerolineales bacterium]